MEKDVFNFTHLISENPVYWFTALAGSALFIIQFLLNLVGGDAHDHVDDSGGEHDSGNFKWLSRQAITGFLMMFGWTGLTCAKQFELQATSSIAIAVAAGVITIFLTGFLFRGARKLHSSGTVFRVEDAIGKEATVYQRIPKDGIGKISISLNNCSYEIDAESTIDEELPSFTTVQVIKKSDDSRVLVAPLK